MLLTTDDQPMGYVVEWARLEHSSDAPELGLDRINDLEEQVQRLTERVDFTENLLGDGQERTRGPD